MTIDQHSARVAIEALRAGVPNRTAIRLLGSTETAIEAAFGSALDATQDGRPRKGLVLAGDFGTGKSHLLGFLREEALRRNFIVSYVTVSKEVPLNAPGLLFTAAMRGASAPGTPDDAVGRILSRLQSRQGAVQDLENWLATPQAGLAQVFAAVAHLLARSLPPDLIHGIESFLCGAKPPTAQVRAKLAELGARGMFDLTGAKAAELTVQRPRFVSELIRYAGYAGWCLLIDEVELIGRYGPLQRANSYVELARWLGLAEETRIPGLHATCTISDDFTDRVIGDRMDDEKLPERLINKGRPREAELASTAMAAIRAPLKLHHLQSSDLPRHAAKLQACYSAAYAWDAPEATIAPPRARQTMRHHIRGWITEWDMLRLQGARTAIQVAPIGSDYSEDETIAVATLDESDSG